MSSAVKFIQHAVLMPVEWTLAKGIDLVLFVIQQHRIQQNTVALHDNDK